MKNLLKSSLLAGLLSTSFACLAADPEIVATWGPGVGTKPVYIYAGMPASCDRPTLYAINVWNAAGAAFAFGWPSNPVTAYRQSEQTYTEDRASITVEDRVPSNSSALMATEVIRSGYDIVDADIFVNSNFLFYGDGATGAFHCPSTTGTAVPAGKYDYQSAMEHELGHALGFQLSDIGEYYGNANCVMYYGLSAGVARRQLCLGEYNEFRYEYGVR